jgi:hypothetical protein
MYTSHVIVVYSPRGIHRDVGRLVGCIAKGWLGRSFALLCMSSHCLPASGPVAAWTHRNLMYHVVPRAATYSKVHAGPGMSK